MSTLFVFDIDGTLAHGGKRFAEAGPEPSRNDKAVYDVWLKNIMRKEDLIEDQHVAGMAHLVEATAVVGKTVYLTARNQSYEEITQKWLTNKSFPKLPLLLRPEDNFQSAAEYKEGTIQFLVRLYESSSVIVFDDDEHGELEKICAKHNWTLLKARSGGQR